MYLLTYVYVNKFSMNSIIGYFFAHLKYIFKNTHTQKIAKKYIF